MNKTLTDFKRSPSDIPMPCLYTTQKDLVNRLDGMIVRYRNQFRVVSVYHKGGGHYGLHLYNIGMNTKLESVDPSDPDLDISMIELGYVNVDKVGVVYLTKSPSKCYKQGFGSSRIKYLTISGTPTREVPFKSMEESLMGMYPRIEDIEIKNKDLSEFQVALSKDVAIARELSGVIMVYIQTKNVAHISRGTVVMKADKLRWMYQRILSPILGGVYDFD